jgi:two-component system LytT family response regulator
MPLPHRTSPSLTLEAGQRAGDVLRVLVADADGAARQRLRLLLDAQPDVELTAECACGRDASEQTRELAPDIVLLDAQTADLDLVTVARATATRPRPMVVLMGERREHATRGFEIEAVDYLLKPITSARLSTALRRAREHRRLVEAAERPVTPPTARVRMQHLLIKTSRRMYLVPVAEVTRFEAYGNYIRVFARGQVHLIRETMDRLETRLDPDAFVRVHRTSIVRIDCIRELQTGTPGAYGVVLADGTRVRMSRLYRARFQERFAAW